MSGLICEGNPAATLATLERAIGLWDAGVLPREERSDLDEMVGDRLAKVTEELDGLDPECLQEPGVIEAIAFLRRIEDLRARLRGEPSVPTN